MEGKNYQTKVIIFRKNIWYELTKLPGPRAFRPAVMMAFTIIIAPFFAAIIVATRQVVGASSPGDSLGGSFVGSLQPDKCVKSLW
jgi:hypothetical protein